VIVLEVYANIGLSPCSLVVRTWDVGVGLASEIAVLMVVEMALYT
jgi:hypothetical protein